MKKIALALAVFAAPFAANAQYTYDRAPVQTRGELRSCMERDEAHQERGTRLDRRKAQLDRETEMLADELRRLDTRDYAAVDRYNTRSDAHNRRVEELNSAASMFNGDTEDLNRTCGNRSYWPQDEQRILRERSSIR